MDRNRWHHFDESPVVFGIIKNVLTVNTAQHHMIDACSAWFSWLSWHNTKFKDYTKTLQRYNLLWEFTNFLEKKSMTCPLDPSPPLSTPNLNVKSEKVKNWKSSSNVIIPLTPTSLSTCCANATLGSPRCCAYSAWATWGRLNCSVPRSRWALPVTALTINCAKQMFIEDERGSISKGKYADFLCFFSRFLWLFEEFLLLLQSDNATS